MRGQQQSSPRPTVLRCPPDPQLPLRQLDAATLRCPSSILTKDGYHHHDHLLTWHCWLYCWTNSVTQGRDSLTWLAAALIMITMFPDASGIVAFDATAAHCSLQAEHRLCAPQAALHQMAEQPIQHLAAPDTILINGNKDLLSLRCMPLKLLGYPELKGQVSSITLHGKFSDACSIKHILRTNLCNI